MQTIHDPYLSSAKRTINEKKIKQRKEKLKKEESKQNSRSFLNQKIEWSHYIDLPTNIQKVIAIGLFLFFPYTIGVAFIFFILAYADFESYYELQMNSFLISWTIGYECLAFMLLSLIIKSAFSFKKG